MFEQVLMQEDNYSDLPLPIFASAPLHSIVQPARPQNGKESRFLKERDFVQTCLTSLSLPVNNPEGFL